MRPVFKFDGWVERSNATASPHHDDLYAPNVSPFAELVGNRLVFRLVPSSPGFGDRDTYYVVMKLRTVGNLHVQVEGHGGQRGPGVW